MEETYVLMKNGQGQYKIIAMIDFDRDDRTYDPLDMGTYDEMAQRYREIVKTRATKGLETEREQ